MPRPAAGCAALIPEPLAGPDISQPVGRCHVALRRLPDDRGCRIIETTFALQQALPAALSGHTEALADGFTQYTAD